MTEDEGEGSRQASTHGGHSFLLVIAGVALVACGGNSASLSSHETGTRFPDCAEAVCRFDCDCAAIDPGVDPCFAGESCECYCSQLAATAGR